MNTHSLTAKHDARHSSHSLTAKFDAENNSHSCGNDTPARVPKTSVSTKRTPPPKKKTVKAARVVVIPPAPVSPTPTK